MPAVKNATDFRPVIVAVLVTSISARGAVQRGVQPVPGDDVGTGRPGEHHRVVPGRPQLGHHVPAHQAGPARHCYPHLPASSVST